MTDALDAFLAEFGARPWVWGEVDCSMVLAAWAAKCGHADGAAPFIGQYASQEECEQIVRSCGGLVALVRARAASLGLMPIVKPKRGAIGVVGSPHNIQRQWGAIHDGVRWMVRMEEGFVPVVAPVLAKWAV